MDPVTYVLTPGADAEEVDAMAIVSDEPPAPPGGTSQGGWTLLLAQLAAGGGTFRRPR